MAFAPTTWIDGTTAITATQLNRIETGIEDAFALVTTTEAGGTVALGGTVGDTVLLPAGLLIAGYDTFGGAFGDVVFEMEYQSTWYSLETAKSTGAGSPREIVQVYSDGTNVRARRVTSFPGGSSIGYRVVVIA